MAPDPIHDYLDELDSTYARLHTSKEDAFWTAKMGLGDDAGRSQSELDAREIELMRFLRDPARLQRTRELLVAARSEDERVRLGGWVKTFASNAIDSAEGRALAEEITADEGHLAVERGEMNLGYVDPETGFVRASSVKLATMLRAEPGGPRRRAAWEGLRSIEPFILDRGFIEIVKKRNRLGRLLGAEDYYDWKTKQNEGMSKAEVFALLDELEARTRDAARRAVDGAESRYGKELMTPWDLPYLIAGDVTKELDPFFPFRAAIDRWGRSFAALGVRYSGADLVLDLLDRKGKYENGFMHGPVVGWRRAGVRIPARIQFTANALPGVVGSGQRALETLFHEGGHAAHFANIDMPSPCFGQEFAPTSVAFAETQSMFFDSLLDDADFMTRYAKDEKGRTIPPSLLERTIDAVQPFAAWSTRAMLSVCYGEKAIYEIPDSELTPDRILEALRDAERRMLWLEMGSPRPVLAVPHLISGESSAYYHGYLLAEMAVHQARSHFLARDGHLVDNPRIGPELAGVWWQPGNSVSFGEFVHRLTGHPLSARHLADDVNAPPEERKKAARDAILRLASIPEFTGPVDLDAKVRVDHGRRQVAELRGDFAAFASEFAAFIDEETARAG
jgi:hypothetical protein